MNSSELGYDGMMNTTSSFGRRWTTAAAISGGSAGIGLVSVGVLVALLFLCKRKCTRRSSYSPDTTGTQTPTTTKRGNTFRKKTSENGYSSPPPKFAHSYETVLPNFAKRPPTAKAPPAQQYEVPLTKAATMPREPCQLTEENNGNTSIKFSHSVQVRGTSPEPPAYMNITKTASSEEFCALNPWNQHAKWSQQGNREGSGGYGGRETGVH